MEKSEPGETVFKINLPIWQMPDLGMDRYENFAVLDDEDVTRKKWEAKILKQNPAAKSPHLRALKASVSGLMSLRALLTIDFILIAIWA